MSDEFTTPNPKTSAYESSSGIGHLRSIRSSEGPRGKAEGIRPPPKYLLLQDQHLNSNEKLPQGERQNTSNSHAKYRIKTSNSAHNNNQKARNVETRGHTAQIRGYVSNPRNQIEDLVGLQQIRSTTAGQERETHKSANRQGGPDVERLVEDTVQLKRHINQLQEENLKLKTRNSNLEKEACKFEKMFQDMSSNPKKKKNAGGLDGANAAGFKQHFRELKDELEDRTEELNALKKKVKFTKINELEVQLRAFQEEGMRMKSHMDDLLYKKALMQKQADEHDSEVAKLKKEMKNLETANQTIQNRYEEVHRQLMEQDKRNKRDQSTATKNLQAKEKEIIKLKSQLIMSTPPQTTTAKQDKAGNGDNKEEKLRKELEKSAFENIDLKGQLKDKNDYIAQLEKQLKDAGIQHAPEGPTASTKQFLVHTPEKVERPNTRDNNQKRAIFDSPSYPVKKAEKEESPEPVAKKENAHTKSLSSEKQTHQPNPSKQSVDSKNEIKHEVKPEPKPESKPEAKPEPKQPKVTQEDVKKLGYEINLTLRVKGKTFDDVEKLQWTKKDNSISMSHVSEVLRNQMFGMKNEDDINLLARYLTQENGSLQIIRSKLTSLIGPLPFWDEDMKKKLHLDISKTCTVNRESLEESLQLHSNGKYLTRKSLDEGAKSIDLPFTFAQLEYIITKLFEKSHDANKLSIETLFEVFHFDVSQHKPSEEDSNSLKRKSQRNTSRSQARSKGSNNDLDHQLKQELDDVFPEYEKDSGASNRNPSDNKLGKNTQNTGRDSGKEYKPEKAYDSEEDNSLDDKSRENKKDAEDYEREIDIISDEDQDPNEENYEYLFPPQGAEEEPQHEKITERGEDEEEDEYYKEKEEALSEEEEEIPMVDSPGRKDKKIIEEDEEEYKDDDYEEAISSENKVKSENEVVEESVRVTDRDHLRMGSGSEMLESRQMMESAKTNFTNTTQITDPKSDFHPFEESKERLNANARSEERLADSPGIVNKKAKEDNRRESQEENKKKLPDITEEYDKHDDFEENFEEEEYDNDFDN